MNRRRFPRWLCSSMVTVTVNEGDCERSQTGVVEDVSRNGLCVATESEIRPGLNVVVSQGPQEFEAVVRYCETDGFETWRVGLEFCGGYQWTQTDVWAEHLLDPVSFSPDHR